MALAVAGAGANAIYPPPLPPELAGVLTARLGAKWDFEVWTYYSDIALLL